MKLFKVQLHRIVTQVVECHIIADDGISAAHKARAKIDPKKWKNYDGKFSLPSDLSPDGIDHVTTELEFIDE